jgi:nucleotide-binding universal stress UspA family protein
MSPRNILVAVDGSEASLDAVAYADDLADKCGASLTLLYAARPHSTLASRESLRDLERVEHIEIRAEDLLQAEADSVLAQAAAKVSCLSKSRVERVSRIGDATENIVGYAKDHGADLIVMGSRGLGNLSGLLLGSVSHKVMQVAHCPCLVVR